MEKEKQKVELTLIAEILEYPQEDFHKKLQKCGNMLENFDEQIRDLFNNFVNYAKKSSIENLQELYVKTFELNSLCTLYAGVLIFGEDGFKRGTFMARLKQAYEEYSLENQNDLPDFIPYILRLASNLKDVDKYNTLLDECILKPLESIISTFQDDTNPYRSLLQSIKGITEHSLIHKIQEAQNV